MIINLEINLFARQELLNIPCFINTIDLIEKYFNELVGVLVLHQFYW